MLINLYISELLIIFIYLNLFYEKLIIFLLIFFIIFDSRIGSYVFKIKDFKKHTIDSFTKDKSCGINFLLFYFLIN